MTYATDGKCHNAEPGTFGHECGRPAVWLGTKPNGFQSGFCDRCKTGGYEARAYKSFQRIEPRTELTAAGEQLVIPGCEKKRSGPSAPAQPSLWDVP